MTTELIKRSSLPLLPEPSRNQGAEIMALVGIVLTRPDFDRKVMVRILHSVERGE